MRTTCCLLTLLILAGCAQPSPQKPAAPKPPSAVEQYKAAQSAFQDKLAASPGLTLAELRIQWGQVRKGLTHNRSTIYHWVQTLSVTPPPEAAAELGLAVPAADAAGQPAPPLSLSCMAVFILQNGVVDEAYSEGLCLDPALMPVWRPVVESAEARRNGRSG